MTFEGDRHPRRMHNCAMPILTYPGEPPRAVEAAVGERILDVSLRLGIPHLHECGGRGRCTTCRVRIDGPARCVTPHTAIELHHQRQQGWTRDIRLACQARVAEDASIEPLMPDAQAGVEQGAASGVLPREARLAIMFVDIRGFTPFALRHLPYDVVHVLNQYFAEVGEPIVANGGQINNYMGDGILALFGLDGQRPAVACAAAMRAAMLVGRRLDNLNRYIEAHFGEALDLGVGLHFGDCVVGEVGHPGNRQLTAVGSAVNFASRVEAHTKVAGARVLVTDAFRRRIEDQVELGPAHHVTLGGFPGRHALYEVRAVKASDRLFHLQLDIERLRPESERLQRLFYGALLDSGDDIRALFSGVDLHAQGELLVSALTTAVRGQSDPARVREGLAALGARHVGYGVRPEHYAAARSAMLGALPEVLGDEWDGDAHARWSALLDQVAEAMVAGAVAVEAG